MAKRPRRLTPGEARLLALLAAGWALKAHRDLEGGKTWRLHPADGPALPVAPRVAEALIAAGLIDSNKKFPAATFWLTPAGRDKVKEK